MSKARNIADLLDSTGDVVTNALDNAALVDMSNVSTLPAGVVAQLKGDKGDKGDTGATGAAGAQGIQGIQGATGESGAVFFNNTAAEGHYYQSAGVVYMYANGGWKQIYPAVYS